ncbi:MAG: TerB family tellurite resistance protein [SAR324 cluster bacterium]|nr:TerB family tellurite resistance protein [SAR324 cluster bacterium]
MKDITKKDLIIIVEGAYQMAQRDTIIEEAEEGLLKKIMDIANIDSEELKKFEDSSGVNIKELSNQLSSNKSKKLFLLTLVAVALADQSVDRREKEMLEDLTKELNVGKINIDTVSYESCEKMIFKLMADNK